MNKDLREAMIGILQDLVTDPTRVWFHSNSGEAAHFTAGLVLNRAGPPVVVPGRTAGLVHHPQWLQLPRGAKAPAPLVVGPELVCSGGGGHDRSGFRGLGRRPSVSRFRAVIPPMTDISFGNRYASLCILYTVLLHHRRDRMP